LAEGLPFGRDFRGWQGYTELMGELKKFYSDLRPESMAYIPYGDDKVIMHFTIDARIAKNGQHFRMPIMTIWRLRPKDKKVVEITIFYFDTKRVADLAAM
jgi:ketosteroid isomerase-like protein